MMKRVDQELLLPGIQLEHREPKQFHLYAITGARVIFFTKKTSRCAVMASTHDIFTKWLKLLSSSAFSLYAACCANLEGAAPWHVTGK